MSKRDLLKECIGDVGGSPPLSEFKAAFCDFCLQSECTRSQAGESLFEKRTATWEDRLFKNPSKLPLEDPRHREIAAQRFTDIAASQGSHLPVLGRAQIPSQQSSWLDPREIQQPEPTPPSPVQTKVKPEPEPEPEPEKTEESKKVDTTPNPEHVENTADSGEKDLSQRRVVKGAPVNTPFQPGAMVGSESQSTTTPPKDAWDAPQTSLEPGVKVLKPGGKFRFGSS